jgi:hypothetical protein
MADGLGPAAAARRSRRPQAGSPDSGKGALAVLTKLVWENMKTRCATSRQRLLSRLTIVERAWRPLVSDRLICDIQYSHNLNLSLYPQHSDSIPNRTLGLVLPCCREPKGRVGGENIMR